MMLLASIGHIGSGIEVVITGLTRNHVICAKN